MTKTNILNFLGLDEKVERVYRALLRLGDASATRISEETGLIRTSVYHTLERLIGMGLVTTYTNRGVRRFVSENPGKIKNYLEQRLILAERIIPELRKEISSPASGTRIKTYIGKEAIKAMNEDALESKERLVFSIGSSGKLIKFLGGKSGYGQRRRSKSIAARSIRFLNDEPPSNPRLNQVKFINEETDFPGNILFYDNKVCIILFEKNGLGFSIESDNFSKMMRFIFDTIWKKI